MGSAGQKRKGRKRLPKVQGDPGRLADGPSGGSPLGVWYGANPWPRGDKMQRDQAVPVRILGAVIAVVILVLLAVALLSG